MNTALWSRPTFVYTAWRNDVPLYVGCTYDLRVRMRAHRADAKVFVRPHWTDEMTYMEIARFENRYLAREAEALRICDLRPEWNCQHNPDTWVTDTSSEVGHERQRAALDLLVRQQAGRSHQEAS